MEKNCCFTCYWQVINSGRCIYISWKLTSVVMEVKYLWILDYGVPWYTISISTHIKEQSSVKSINSSDRFGRQNFFWLDWPVSGLHEKYKFITLYRKMPAEYSWVNTLKTCEKGGRIGRSFRITIKSCFPQVINKGGVAYKNTPWHRECFTCLNCELQLAGEKFTSVEEKPYCAKCYADLFAKKCCRCSDAITGSYMQFYLGSYQLVRDKDYKWPSFNEEKTGKCCQKLEERASKFICCSSNMFFHTL